MSDKLGSYLDAKISCLEITGLFKQKYPDVDGVRVGMLLITLFNVTRLRTVAFHELFAKL